MYEPKIRRGTRLEKLMCSWFGHQMAEGLKYHSATKRGSSMVCRRCGVYEVLERALDDFAPSARNDNHPTVPH